MKSVEELKAIQEFGKTLINRNYEEVKTELKEKQIRFRVTKVDNNVMMTTCDMRPERLNFELENGLITKVTFG